MAWGTGGPTDWRRAAERAGRQGIAPVLVGEWGGREVGLDTVEGRRQRQFVDYLARTGISWTYWALNPDSGDPGGVLRDRLDVAEPCSARRPGVSQAASRAPYLAHRTSRTARPPAPIASPAPPMSPRMRAT